MATTLGKRKRRPVEATNNEAHNTSESFNHDTQEIFRKHFEAQFKPLPAAKIPVKVVEEISEDVSEEESEWGGISDEEGVSVQVIEHTDAETRMAAMSKEQLKAFMVRSFIRSNAHY
jgi:hypothetical protein